MSKNSNGYRRATRMIFGLPALRRLGRVDGFDQDEAESKRDERAVILRRLAVQPAVRSPRVEPQ